MIPPVLHKEYCELRVWAAELRDEHPSEEIRCMARTLISMLNTYLKYKNSPSVKAELWRSCKIMENQIKQELSG